MNQNPPQRRQSLYCSQLPVVVIAAGFHLGGGTRGAFAPPLLESCLPLEVGLAMYVFNSLG